MATAPTTEICGFNKTNIFVRGEDLCDDLIGSVSFTDYMFFLIMGKKPTEQQRAIVDASLVAIADHGLSPGAVVSRMTYMGAPESLQGAVAAGLLGVGDVLVGTSEAVAPLLQQIVSADDPNAEARKVAEDFAGKKMPIPGFGQPHHKPDDPRPAAIFRTAEQVGLEGRHIEALKMLSVEVDAAAGRHITINGPGAIGAAFLDIGIPISIMRGFMIVARSAGLVAQLHEEQSTRAGKNLWNAAADALPYSGEIPAS